MKMKACARISSNRNGPAGTSLRLGHLRFWALSYHHEDRNPLTGSPATAGSPSSPKGPRGRGLLLSWTGGEAWFINRTTWMTLVATTDSVLGGVASGDRKGRSGKDKPNGLNVLIINNIYPRLGETNPSVICLTFSST